MMARIHSSRAGKRRNFAVRLGVSLLCSAVVAACAQGKMQASPRVPMGAVGPQAEETAYKLDAGDRLRVIVFGETDISGEYEVDGSGLIRLPLVGQVQAGGLALGEFEGNVKSALEGGYLRNARVSVEVINYRPFYILGQVNKPGEYAYVNGMTVLSAVALAGGYTYRANETTVYLRRRGSEEQRPVPADEAIRVQPGDIITVRERFF
jgi:protein involved in polysaccharide export with SLBB domain